MLTLKSTALLAALVTALSLPLASCVTAQPEPPAALVPPQNCLPADALENRLAMQHGEERAGFGLMPTGVAVMLSVSEAGSWSISTVSPTGLGCLVLSGIAWSTPRSAR